MYVGKASVTVVPLIAPTTVPAGTFVLLIAAPGEIEPADPTVVESELAVVAREVVDAAQATRFIGPRKPKADPGPTAENEPMTQAVAWSPAGGTPGASIPTAAAIAMLSRLSLIVVHRGRGYRPENVDLALASVNSQAGAGVVLGAEGTG